MKSIRISLISLLAIFLLQAKSIEPGYLVSGIITDADDGNPLAGVSVVIKGSQQGVISDLQGKFQLRLTHSPGILQFYFIGYKNLEITVKGPQELQVTMTPDHAMLHEVVTTGYKNRKASYKMLSNEAQMIAPHPAQLPGHYPHEISDPLYMYHETENYEYIKENTFQSALKQPLSTFSIDVDAASYANVRRFINLGQRPPTDAVRIEELINYFSYDYPQPKDEHPFSITTEYADCPWNAGHKLLHIGLQGEKIEKEHLPPSNLTFLIDVSGSMFPPNRLPLLKSALRMLVDELREQDKVSIVVYAGAAGKVLDPTPGSEKETIIKAIENLEAGGSTAGGAGIKLAYKTAEENFIKGGNNRIILATDGDFNVGVSSNAELERLIETERDKGVYLTILGVGMGNYKDDRLERLSNKGNGNFAYIDNLQEARKVLVSEFGGTLFTIAKDVKLQIEFNPAKVQSYRLIGYENRIMPHEDFNNDKKDAGDMGAGHSVTALYEIVPVGSGSSENMHELKYQQKPVLQKSSDLLTLKIRYKKPDGHTSRMFEQSVSPRSIRLENSSENFRFSAAVALYGMLLRDSEFVGGHGFKEVIALAENALGLDKEGYRKEFINKVKTTPFLSTR
ncbi:MAG: von Willebrand factor type A domain-containing protein [Cyclobacteriaceae bacterium]|nr:von Willebrand factor type A domain-containing protein [Cyclobacteriaceae bacterium]